MRIGLLTACYKPVVNGVTQMVSLYHEHLTQLGHEVTIFTPGKRDPADEPWVVRTPAMPLGDSGYHVTLRFDTAVQNQIREMEIIHCHHLYMSVEMAHRYATCPIVYTNHTRYDLYMGAYTPLPQTVADLIMRQVWPTFAGFADLVIAPTESVRQILREFGVEQPIEVIENGIDRQPFLSPDQPKSKAALGLPDDAVLAVYVGRLSSEKNLSGLIAQFAQVVANAPQAHLLIIGSGPQREHLNTAVSHHKLTRHVHFSGVMANDAIPNYLAAADLFVTASTTEVHPLTVIEAMAAGLPIVGIDSPGLRGTVQSNTSGLLVPKERDLASAIAQLISNPAQRQQMGEQARQESERFDIEDTVYRTYLLYERLREQRPDLTRRKQHGRWRPFSERPFFPENIEDLL